MEGLEGDTPSLLLQFTENWTILNTDENKCFVIYEIEIMDDERMKILFLLEIIYYF